MKDLTTEVQNVFQAKTLEQKKSSLEALIAASEAKKATKDKALRDLQNIKALSRLDQFAFNFMAAGEGMKVIK